MTEDILQENIKFVFDIKRWISDLDAGGIIAVSTEDSIDSQPEIGVIWLPISRSYMYIDIER